jgi:hypothetical protein
MRERALQRGDLTVVDVLIQRDQQPLARAEVFVRNGLRDAGRIGKAGFIPPKPCSTPLRRSGAGASWA